MDFFRVKLTGESQGLDLDGLYRRFWQYPNLKLVDSTVQTTDLWKNAGDDTLEGIYFRLLREKANQADADTRADLELAAKLSRQILLGREVTLP